MLSSHLDATRDALAAHALRRDTQLLEWILGLTALAHSWRASIVQPDGTPLAPFLSSALRYLSFDRPLWVAALAASGALGLVCLTVGARHNSFLLPRAAVAGLQCVIWTAIVAAILTAVPPGATPVAASIGYIVAAHGAFLNTFVLTIQYLKDRQEARSGAGTRDATDAEGGADAG